MATSEGEKQTCWYVMRDLKRANAKLPAYKQLLNEHFEVFTPMKEQLSVMIPRKLLIRLWKSIPRYSIVSRREVVTKIR